MIIKLVIITICLLLNIFIEDFKEDFEYDILQNNNNNFNNIIIKINELHKNTFNNDLLSINFNDTNYYIVYCTHNKNVIGFTILKELSNSYEKGIGLYSLNVAVDYRNKGIATKLISLFVFII